MSRFIVDSNGVIPPHVIYTPASGISFKTIIHCHGNGTDVEAMELKMLKFANAMQSTLVSWEYPGYGPREADPCYADKICIDVVELYDHLVRNGTSEDDIIIFGHSIGSGPAVWLASQRKHIGGLILQSPYTSIRDIVRDKVGWWVGSLCPTVFDNETAIASITAPILLIHGQRDTLISPKHSKKLAAAALQSVKIKERYVPGVTHSDMWNLEEDIIKPVCDFLLQELK